MASAATANPPATKASPHLEPARRGRFGAWRDLMWLTRLAAGQAPAPAAKWSAAAIAIGMATPVQLYVTKHLVDALAAHVQAAQGLAPGFAAGLAGGSRTTGIWLWVAVLLGSLLAERMLGGFEGLLSLRMREYVGPALRALSMRKAGRLDLVAFEHQAYYDQLDKVMSGAEERGTDLLTISVGWVQRLPAVVSFVVVLAIYSPVLLLIALCALLPTTYQFLSAGRINWSVLNEQTRERRLADAYGALLGSRVHAAEVRLYDLSGHFLDRWSRLYWQTRNEQRRVAFRLGLKQRGLVFLTLALNMGGLWFVVYAGLVHASPGGYALIFSALGGLWGVFELAQGLMRLGELTGYAGELRTFLNLPEEGQGRSASAAGSLHSVSTAPATPAQSAESLIAPLQVGIRLEDVWFTYPDSAAPALSGVDFELQPGEKLALVGENGAGKSTLIKLLLGYYRPDRGRITWGGIDVAELDPCALRRQASAVFQQFVQYQLTLRENIGLSSPEHMSDLARIAAAAARAGADGIAVGLTDGYEALLGPDVGGTELSGGQWQRVALARGFFRDASVLVLDEPTAALDPKAELAVFQRFVELAAGRTTVLVSHRLGVARLADRILVLNGGRVAEHGPHEHLLAAGGEYAALFDAQARWYR